MMLSKRSLLLPAALAYLNCVLSASTNDNTLKTFPSEVRVTRAVEHCARTVSTPGVYRLVSNEKPGVCTLKVKSPINTRIKLKFAIDPPEACVNILLSAFDGWQYRKFMQLHAEEKTESGTHLICPNENWDREFTSSQNAAEVFYWYPPNFSSDVQLEIVFENQEQACDVMLDPGSFGDELTISNNGHKGICHWFLPGAVRFQLTESDLMPIRSGQKCGTKQTSYLRLQTGDTTPHLTADICADYNGSRNMLLPCKRVEIILHSASHNTTERVKFRLEPASFMDTLVWDSIC